ncbi:hypothetical protein HOU02_gp066 [Caulobacter phage CcrBL9]|uniref:Uncharacterized protein n=1 Tax=Caulobacter phage CcrBL9 TaxID=2283270 RepID=A0A385EBR3_9CAUD|nr:hypothetical protein HOU02_gp066 [Caulobacter phage CcrBL9]AXQ69090.1 hypothetical protein CcrBL9_gp066c [Caulobacter phage CcrBL9]
MDTPAVIEMHAQIAAAVKVRERLRKAQEHYWGCQRAVTEAKRVERAIAKQIAIDTIKGRADLGLQPMKDALRRAIIETQFQTTLAVGAWEVVQDLESKLKPT